MDEDIKKLVEENNTTVEDNKAEFLIADYYVSFDHFWGRFLGETQK